MIEERCRGAMKLPEMEREIIAIVATGEFDEICVMCGHFSKSIYGVHFEPNASYGGYDPEYVIEWRYLDEVLPDFCKPKAYEALNKICASCQLPDNEKECDYCLYGNALKKHEVRHVGQNRWCAG